MNESFLRDIRSQEEAIRTALPDLRRQAHGFSGSGDRRVVLAGSGDSLIASIAAANAFDGSGGSRVTVRPSLDAARFHPWSPADIAVVSSISGEVSASLEVAEIARGAGARTVAITSGRSSSLAQIADESLVLPAPIDRTIPHARDYTQTLLGLAVVLESLRQEPARELDRWAAVVDATLEDSFELMASIEPCLGTTWFLGAGPDRATAWYGALKYWEAAGIPAGWDDLEEFAHGSLLMARPGDRAIVIASRPATERAGAMLPGLVRMGLDAITVGEERPEGSIHHLATGSIGGPQWHPYVACLPLQALTYRGAVERGRDVSVLLDGLAFGPTYDEVHRGWTRRGVSAGTSGGSS